MNFNKRIIERIQGLSPVFATIVSVVSFVIAVGSFWTSCQSLEVSRATRSDARAVARLDLRPSLTLQVERAGKDGLPLTLRLTNDGPIEATELVVEPIKYEYWGKDRRFKTASKNSILRFTHPKLDSQQSTTVAYDEQWLRSLAVTSQPPDYSVLGIRIEYRHPMDKRPFTEAAFFFVNPEGRWVEEGDSSLPLKIYDPIRSSLLEFVNRVDFMSPGIKLYTLKRP